MVKVFEKDSKVHGVLWHWWDNLDNRRGDRAELRRADSLSAVVFCPAYQRLYGRLVDAGWLEVRQYRAQDDHLAAAIGLMVHVKRHEPGKSPVKAMGAKDGDRPAVSELRFLRLLDSPDIESLFNTLRRLLPMMEKSGFSVMELVNDVLGWGDEVKKKWAYEYDWPAKADH